MAQTSSRFFANPPELQPVQPPRLAGNALTALRPPTGGPAQQEVTYDLQVKFADTTIYNPNTGKNDPVHVRAYNGTLIAPTISVEPSQTVRILLENQLPVESEAACPPPEGQNHTVPSCFSTTNLHYHGLHVSPTGNSDNVLLQIAPGQHFAYEINIPADHPAGTFWYHSHRHGSTALEVASGMEGPLIVRGRRSLSQRAIYGTADIDTVLRKATGAPLDEQILLFQQIPYACFVQEQWCRHQHDPDRRPEWEQLPPSSPGPARPMPRGTSGRARSSSIRPSSPSPPGPPLAATRWSPARCSPPSAPSAARGRRSMPATSSAGA